MRQIKTSSWNHYAPFVSLKFKLAEAEAQLSTLRGLGEAIRLERQRLANEQVPQPDAGSISR
jgi:hypothetical protein